MPRRKAQLPLLTLQALAHLTGVPSRLIRRYESEGLVVARRVVLQGGRTERLYLRSTVEVVRRIRSYEALGVNLPGIEMILRLVAQLELVRGAR